ncbi:hypothetical protein Golob_023095, partial [Gossypium lobatum]|nr:hypothetical protein [Gossypium lobatum]
FNDPLVHIDISNALLRNGNTHGILESSGETKKLKELEESGTTIFIDALGRLVRDVGDKVISIHFNPAFEDLSIVPMALNERGSGGNFVGSKGGWKINKTLKGPSNQFKATDSSRVSFLRTMLKVADLITSELEGHAVQEKAAKGKEIPNCHVFSRQ